MKTCITSYSFARSINSGNDNQLSIIKKAADMGFDGIEFTDLQPPEGIGVSNEKEFAAIIRDEAEKYNLNIVCYTIGADLLKNDLKREVKRIKDKIDVAEILGTGCIRHDLSFGFKSGERKYKGFTNVLPLFTEACTEITCYGAKKGIKTTVENHGLFCQDSTWMEMLVNGVAHENFGLLVDIGNFMCADEDSAVAVGRTAAYAFHVHVKDFIVKDGCGMNPGEGFFTSRGGMYLRGTVPGHGAVPIKKCLNALKSAGYSGYVSLEFEGEEVLDYALRAGFDNIKRCIKQIETS